MLHTVVGSSPEFPRNPKHSSLSSSGGLCESEQIASPLWASGSSSSLLFLLTVNDEARTDMSQHCVALTAKGCHPPGSCHTFPSRSLGAHCFRVQGPLPAQSSLAA